MPDSQREEQLRAELSQLVEQAEERLRRSRERTNEAERLLENIRETARRSRTSTRLVRIDYMGTDT